MPEIIIHSPYSEHAGQGNSVSALRMEKLLSGSGLRVSHSQGEYQGDAADVMIALNARKSAKAIARFRYLHPTSKLVIVLTGTDINHPDSNDESSATWTSMKLADRLVVLHEASLKQLPECFLEKTSIIYPSVMLPPDLKHAPDGEFTIVMAGNMRQEKNPELAVNAAEKIFPALKIHHYGESESIGSEHVIEHGIVSHDEMFAAMSKADILLNTSHQEGGANALCEAIAMGLPVVASAIPGNIGMLGEDYAGLFPSNDLEALVGMLEKVAGDEDFYVLLKNQVAAREPIFSTEREGDAWRELLDGMHDARQ